MQRTHALVLVLAFSEVAALSLATSSCSSGRRGGGGVTPTSCTTVCNHVAAICAGIDTSSCATDCPASTADQRTCALSAMACADLAACMGSSCACDTGGGCQTGCACDADCGTSDPCAAYSSSCTSCTEQAGCGFCGARGCVSGTTSGPSTGSCSGAWQWTTSDCSTGCTCNTGAGCQSGCACDPDCSASVIGTACTCPAAAGVVSCSSADTCTGGVYECLSLGTTSGFCVAPCSAASVDMPCSVGGLCSTITYNSTTYYYCVPAG